VRARLGGLSGAGAASAVSSALRCNAKRNNGDGALESWWVAERQYKPSFAGSRVTTRGHFMRKCNSPEGPRTSPREAIVRGFLARPHWVCHARRGSRAACERTLGALAGTGTTSVGVFIGATAVDMFPEVLDTCGARGERKRS
jgi:hypothetical protein